MTYLRSFYHDNSDAFWLGVLVLGLYAVCMYLAPPPESDSDAEADGIEPEGMSEEDVRIQERLRRR